MDKWNVYKFFIYVFFGISAILTFLMFILPSWDNLDNGDNVGVLLSNNTNTIEFGFMSNDKSNESALYRIMAYTVVYLLIIILLNLGVIAFLSLNKWSSWMNIIFCCGHAFGEVFIFIIYSIRYMIEWVSPLTNYYLCIVGILINIVLFLLLNNYRRLGKKYPSISKIDTIKYPETSVNPDDITQGIAIPVYTGNEPVVDAQDSVKKPEVDPSKIVISDNIVDMTQANNDDEPIQDNNYNENGMNQVQQPNLPATTTVDVEYAQVNTDQQQAPFYNTYATQPMNSQYDYAYTTTTTAPINNYNANNDYAMAATTTNYPTSQTQNMNFLNPAIIYGNQQEQTYQPESSGATTNNAYRYSMGQSSAPKFEISSPYPEMNSTKNHEEEEELGLPEIPILLTRSSEHQTEQNRNSTEFKKISETRGLSESPTPINEEGK